MGALSLDLCLRHRRTLAYDTRVVRQTQPFGKYLLLERISVGGMAEVFKAKQFGAEGFDKLLAIKRILPSMAQDSDFISMFIDEQIRPVNLWAAVSINQTGGSTFLPPMPVGLPMAFPTTISNYYF